jgi:hypothetical protein
MAQPPKDAYGCATRMAQPLGPLELVDWRFLGVPSQLLALRILRGALGWLLCAFTEGL